MIKCLIVGSVILEEVMNDSVLYDVFVYLFLV